MDDNAIAIVGMACRFAGASKPSQLWDLVVDGKSAHSPIPSRSFNANAWYHPNRERSGAVCTTSGHFLEDVSHFDSAFFSIGVDDAKAMDPMQRLGLEVAYEGFENAGLTLGRLSRSRTAVYTAVMTNDYQAISESDAYNLGTNAAAGTGKAMLSNRISWFFDLKGPSLTLDTACSSGLYGLHLACQGLKSYECDQALVTGVNLILHPCLMAQLSQMHMISPDGVSHSFDSSANGYGRGEGVAGLVVKRLPDAIRDGDVIRAVIRATGANHDGKTTSITMPSEEAQADLITETYRAANIPLDQTCYFEAHGTGTPQGDPIEVRAIAKTLGAARSQSSSIEETLPLFVGSVKTNVGHTEGCAGIAGVIKTVLCLESGWIPPVAGLSEINPEISPVLSRFNMVIPTDNMRWPNTPGNLRRASVNSFGFGGSNAHIILDDAASYLQTNGMEGVHATTAAGPFLRRRSSQDSDSAYSSRSSGSEVQSPLYPPDPGPTCEPLYSLPSRLIPLEKPSSPARLYLLSAHDEEGLVRTAESYASYLEDEQARGSTFVSDPASSMNSLAHVLATRTSHHYFRGFTVAAKSGELLSNLLDKNTLLPPKRASNRSNIIFVFTGQGAQRPGMARELLDFPVFAASIYRSQEYLNALGCDWDICNVLSAASADTINRPEYSQPLCTAVQIALVHLLSEWNVRPAAVIGHSSGEIVAALAAGAISHEDAIRVSWFRGHLSADLPRRSSFDGAMLAVGISEDDATKFIASLGLVHVNVACVNSPSSVTLAGPRRALSELNDHLIEKGKFARLLRTSVAYHSPQMADLADDYATALATLESPRPTRVPLYSSVTEELTQGEDLGAEYWLSNMKKPVRFAGALANLLRNSTHDINGEYSSVLEIGPTKTLEGPIRQIIAGVSPRLGQKLAYISTLDHRQDAHRASLQAAGQLWATGHPIDMDEVNQTSRNTLSCVGPILARRPTYPWSHKHAFWHETSNSRSACLRERPRTDLLGVSIDSQNPFEPRWRNILDTKENPWLLHHNVASTVLFPAAGYLVMALEAVLTLVEDATDTTVHESMAKEVVQSIEFFNVEFESGLVIPEARGGVEVSLTVNMDNTLPNVFSFATYSASRQDTWTRLCHGYIQVNLQPKTDDGFGWQALQEEWEAQQSVLRRFSDSSGSTTVDVAKFYDRLSSLGLNYGSTFQGLVHIKTVPGEPRAWGQLEVPDTKSAMPNQFEYPHLIHPATLDSAFQLVFASLEAQGALSAAAVPISVKRILIEVDIQREAGSVFVGTADARRVDDTTLVNAAAEKGGRATVIAGLVFTDEQQTGPKIVIEDIRLQDVPFGSLEGTDEADSLLSASTTRRSARVLWKEDVEHLDMNDGLGFELFPKWTWDKHAMAKSLEHLCYWLDRLCHKRAGLNVALVNMDPRHANILLRMFEPREDLDCRFTRADTMTMDDIKSLTNVGRNESELYDLVFLGAALPPTMEKEVLPSILAPDGKIVSFDQRAPDGRSANGSLRPFVNDNAYQMIFQWLSEDKCPEMGHLCITILARSDLSPIKIEGSQDLLSSVRSIVVLERDTTDRPTSLHYCRLRDSLCSHLESFGIAIRLSTVSSLSCTPGSLADAMVISLLECDQPWVYTWSSDKHVQQFRDLVTQARYILWITTGGIAVDYGDQFHDWAGQAINEDYSEEMLKYAPTSGLLRSVRAEYPQLSLPHLDISPRTYHKVNSDEEEAGTTKMILSVLQSTIKKSPASVACESEFAERNGRLWIPRIVGHQPMDAGIQSNRESSHSDQTQAIAHRGAHRDEMDEGELRPDEVLVRLDAVAIQAVQDTHEGQHTVLREATGTIEACGKRSSGYTTNSRVICLLGPIDGSGFIGQSHGAWRTHGTVILRTKQVFEFPAVLAEGMFNILHLLYWAGPLVQAWNVLRRCGLVQTSLCQLSPVAMDSFAPRSLLLDVSDELLREALLRLCRYVPGLRQVFVIGSKPVDESGRQGVNTVYMPHLSRGATRFVLKATDGIGVDTVVTCMEHPATTTHLVTVLAPCGGKLVVVDADEESRVSLARYAALTSSDTSVISVKSPQMVDDAYSEICRSLLELVADGQILTRPTDWATSPDVHHSNVTRDDLFKESQKIGSSSGSELAPGQRSTIALLPPPPSSSSAAPCSHFPSNTQHARLDPNGTYVIAGGLGALGLEVACSLFERGAGHVLLLSRSGSTSDPTAMTALGSFSQRQWDWRIVKCDITCRSSVLSLASMLIEEDLLPLRGVIQCAMVLQDSMLQNMTIDKWANAVNPKIQGSWNLHKHLHLNLALQQKEKLEFFILFSSVSGIIGNTAQSNYSAGNTFEDALAHFRRSKGLPAVSLNIGLVSDARHFRGDGIGAFKSAETYLALFGHLAPVVVSLDEVKAALATILEADLVGRPQFITQESEQTEISPLPAQIVVGISDRVPRHSELLNRWPFDPKFDHRVALNHTRQRQNETVSLIGALKSAKSPEDAVLVVEDALRAKVAMAVSTDVTNVDAEKPLSAYGVDSLKATEVRNWLISSFEAQISIFEILSPIPISKLAHVILEKSGSQHGKEFKAIDI